MLSNAGNMPAAGPLTTGYLCGTWLILRCAVFEADWSLSSFIIKPCGLS